MSLPNMSDIENNDETHEGRGRDESDDENNDNDNVNFSDDDSNDDDENNNDFNDEVDGSSSEEEDSGEQRPLSKRNKKMTKSVSSRGLSKNKGHGERLRSLTNLFNEFSTIRELTPLN